MKTLVTVCHPDLKKIIFSEATIAKLNGLSEVTWVPEGESYCGEPLEKIIGDFDAVISGWRSPKLTRKVLEQASKLKFIGHTAGTIVPFIDPLAFDRNITIVNANNSLARSTTEFCLALMLCAAWQIPQFIHQLKGGSWVNNERDLVMGLERQTVGLIGYGEISRMLIPFLKFFHAHILLHSHHVNHEQAREMGAEICSLDELLRRSQIISLHNTLTSQSRGMIGKRELTSLQDGALLINTARGPIIDETALIEILKTGRIYAALDVYQEEPLPVSHPLLNLPNVICTPHIGSFSKYWRSDLGASVVADMERWLKQEPLLGEVTRKIFERQTPK
ncbi:MAG: hydroxyacid dehydrogenase [Candidatus Zhuqueibacterota bacterium]